MKRHKNIIILLLSQLSLAGSTHAQSTADFSRDSILLTLEEAIQLTLRYNPEIDNAELQRLNDKFQLDIAYREFDWKMPSISTNYSYTNTITENSNSESDNIGTSSNLNKKLSLGTNISIAPSINYNSDEFNSALDISIEQPLMRGFGRNVVLSQLRQAQTSEVINQLNLKKTVQDTINNAIKQYRILIENKINVENQRDSLANSQHILRQTRALIASGQKAPYDLNQAQNSYAQALLALDQSVNQYEKNLLAFIQLMGLPPETPITLPGDIGFYNTTIPPISESQALAITSDIDYLIQQLTISNSKQQLIVNKDDLLPTLNLNVSSTLIGNSYDDSSSNRPFDWRRDIRLEPWPNGLNQAGDEVTSTGKLDDSIRETLTGRQRADSSSLNFEIPIQNLAGKKTVSDQIIAIEKAENELDKRKRTIETNVLDGIRNVQIILEQYQRANLALGFTEKTYQAAQQRYDSGQITLFELVQQNDSLTSARNELISKKIAYLNAITDFDNTIGNTLERWNVTIKQ